MNADYKTPQLTVSPEIQNNFMNVIGLEDSEIAFSNMISYFFSKYPALFNAFLRQYYKKTMNPIQIDITKMTVEREKNRIDIYITDGTWHIIIENKIKSGINGVEKQKNSEGKYESQLSKYIQSLKNLKPEKENNENGDTPKGVDEKNIRCYLFLPRYATSKIKLDDFKDGDKYKIVNYKMLWDFFAQYLPTIKFQNENEKLFYSFFLDAMSKHTKEHDTDIVERMQRRFMDRINDLNANKE